MAASPISLLSRFAHALNPRAREGLCALLPDHVASALHPSEESEEAAGWEAALLEVLRQPTDGAEGDESAQEGAEGPGSLGLVALSALLLSACARPQVGAQFLYNLPLHLQAPVLHRLLTRSSLSCLRDLPDEEGAWVAWLRSHLGGKEHWGVERAVSIMRGAEQPRSMRQLLEAVAAIDRRTALVLQQHLYHFTDLLQLSDRDVQLVLASEATETLALALSGLEPAARKGFMAHISKRRRVLIDEEAERYSEATADEIDQAQGAVLAMARLLYERRRITTYMGALKAEKAADERPEATCEEEGEEAGDQKAKRRKKNRRRNQSKALAKLGLVAACTALFAGVYLLMPRADGNEQGEDGRSKKDAALGEESSSSVQVLLDALDAGGAKEDSGQGGNPQREQPQHQALIAVPGTDGVFAEGEFGLEERGVEGEPDSTLRVLSLRVGRLQATVLQAGFVVETPLLRIRAPVGSVYSVRVVLDATTQVRVEKGRVEIEAIAGRDGRVRLVEGESRTFAAGEDW